MARFMAVFTGKEGASHPNESTIAPGMKACGEWTAR